MRLEAEIGQHKADGRLGINDELHIVGWFGATNDGKITTVENNTIVKTTQ